MTFDRTIIHNLAAKMFWRMAERLGVAKTSAVVIASEGRLIEHRYGDGLGGFQIALMQRGRP